MRTITGHDNGFGTRRPVYATVGMFDGMHAGHLALVRKLVFWARVKGAFCAVVTFDRHPREVVGAEPPPLITPLSQRLYILERLGLDGTAVLPFDEGLASLSAEEFVTEVLAKGLGVKGILLGFNNRFGRGGRGDYALLSRMGGELGIEVRRGPEVWMGGAPLSSTRIREAVRAGRLALAEKLLGRRYSVFGRVTAGKGIGHELGFPTANIEPLHALIPPCGVYASITRVGNAFHPSATYVGRKEEGGCTVVETHIMGFEGDLYGEEIEVVPLERIRGERRFADAGALRRAIAEDVKRSYTIACGVRL